MDQDIKKTFIKIIKEQTKLYEELHKIAESENRLLDSRKVDGLEKILKSEEDKIVEIGNKEKEKYEVFIGLAESCGMRKDEVVNLEDVLRKIDKDDAEEIAAEMEQLLATVRKVNGLNSKNSHLIKNYLGVLNFSKELAEKAKAPRDVTVYNNKGVVWTKKETKRKGFDSKI